MKRRRPDCKWELVAAKMPPKKHSVKNQEFSIRNSEALKWLIAQDEILQMVFDRASTRGLIVYDSKSECWRGRDWK